MPGIAVLVSRQQFSNFWAFCFRVGKIVESIVSVIFKAIKWKWKFWNQMWYVQNAGNFGLTKSTIFKILGIFSKTLASDGNRSKRHFQNFWHFSKPLGNLLKKKCNHHFLKECKNSKRNLEQTSMWVEYQQLEFLCT